MLHIATGFLCGTALVLGSVGGGWCAVLPIGGFDESQKSSKELGVGWSLDRLIGLEIDRNQDRPGFGFP